MANAYALYAVSKIVNRNAIGMPKERDQWGQVTDVIALAAIATTVQGGRRCEGPHSR